MKKLHCHKDCTHVASGYRLSEASCSVLFPDSLVGKRIVTAKNGCGKTITLTYTVLHGACHTGVSLRCSQAASLVTFGGQTCTESVARPI